MGSLVHGLWIQQEALPSSPSGESNSILEEMTAETVQVSPNETTTPRVEAPSIPGWAWLLLIPVLAPVLYYVVTRRSKFGGATFTRRLDQGEQPENHAYRDKVSPVVDADRHHEDSVDEFVPDHGEEEVVLNEVGCVSDDPTDQQRWKTDTLDANLESPELENASEEPQQESEFGSEFLDGFDDDSLSEVDLPDPVPVVDMEDPASPASAPTGDTPDSLELPEPSVAALGHHSEHQAVKVEAKVEERRAKVNADDATDPKVAVAPATELEKFGLLESELESMHAELSQSRATTENLRSQLSASNTALEKTQTRLEETQSRLEETQSQRQAIQSELDERQSLLDKTCQQLDEARKQLAARDDTVADLNRQVAQLHAEAETAATATQDTAQNVQQRLDDVTQENASLQQTIDRQTAQITELEAELENRSEPPVAPSSDTRREEDAARIQALETKLDEKRKLIHAAKKKLDERKLKIERLQKKLLASRSELAE